MVTKEGVSPRTRYFERWDGLDREGIVSQRPRRERCLVAVTATVTPRLFGLRHMPRGSESHMEHATGL